MVTPLNDGSGLFLKRKAGRGLCLILLFCGAPLLAEELEPLDEDFLMFVGEWADEQGDIQASEALEMLLPKLESEGVTDRQGTEDRETREELRDE
ncbi:hypothetical protein [Microbulbifer sp. THAF38]|uniref:hypothetical protein n=1 Tax=Microbulbifer sp. THAF38 TaxID=2587856 RepID=UPI001268CB5C|nr:hypothetical protein [Microbulbifer sp. THAF38]QFT55750.1 hypothetical protein FIU95_14465 [Microbulbifer sp. THAF38]